MQWLDRDLELAIEVHNVPMLDRRGPVVMAIRREIDGDGVT